jgi:valyl-tRNA synthetase
MEAVRSIRNIRAEMKVPAARKIKVLFIIEDEELGTIFNKEESTFMRLSGVSGFTVSKNKSDIPDGAVSSVISGVEIFIPLEDLIDFDKELKRLYKEKENLEDELKRVNGKLGNESFVSKAPVQVVEAEREKQKKYSELYEKVIERINFIKSKM